MPASDREPEPGETDPSMVERLLEIELIQKRAAWQQAKARRGSRRAMIALEICELRLCNFEVRSFERLPNLFPAAECPRIVAA